MNTVSVHYANREQNAFIGALLGFEGEGYMYGVTPISNVEHLETILTH